MKKIILTIGIQGSGKSTYANKLFSEQPELYRIVNRDKIRQLLFGYTEENAYKYYERDDLHKLEKEVTKYETLLIKEILADDNNLIPIVDATHLDKKYLQRFHYFNVKIEYVWFDCDLDIALERNSARNRKVSEDVIKKAFIKYVGLKSECYVNPSVLHNFIEPIGNDKSKKHCIVVDIDGTIAHFNGRGAYEWHKTFSDLPDENVLELIKNINNDNLQIIFCSGRSNECEKMTFDWIGKHLPHIPFTLFMRDSEDNRADYLVKYDMWQKICKTNYITCMIDDRSQVVDFARSLGFKVLQCQYRNF